MVLHLGADWTRSDSLIEEKSHLERWRNISGMFESSALDAQF